MKESAPHKPNPEVNMFELVDHEGVSVPRFLLENDREADLAEYIRGWKAQNERIGTKLVYGNVDNYYDLGATKNWITTRNRTEYESETTGEMDLDHKMFAMRANLHRVPKEAWSNEDFGSDRKMDNGINIGATPRYYSPEIFTPTDISTDSPSAYNPKEKDVDSSEQVITTQG